MGFVPLYQRIKDQIVADVLNQPAASGDGRLPTERELESRYQVSRPTISKALAALAAEGLLVKAPGRGMHLATPPSDPSRAQVSRRIGFVAPISTEALVRRSFSGASRAARRRGYCALLGGSENDVAHEQEVVEELIASGVQGVIIYPVPRTHNEVERDFLRFTPPSVPVVLIDTALPEQGHLQVVFDNRKAGYEITSWLLGKGCRRIGVLFYLESVRHGPLDERLVGYRQAMSDHGIQPIPSWIRRFTPSIDKAKIQGIIHDWLSQTPRLDAIVAADDVAALDVIGALCAAGVRVGEEIRVTGFDNREVARHFRPAFPTTTPDFERLGALAGDLLLDSIETGINLPRTYVLDVPILVRKTSSVVLTTAERHAKPIRREFEHRPVHAVDAATTEIAIDAGAPPKR